MILSDYRIVEQLGEFNYIYKALDVNNRLVIIKKVKDNSDSAREVEYHQQLSNLSFIPTLYESFIENEYRYLVMELIDYPSLHQSWTENKSCNYYWVTVIHALRIIRELHNHDFYHGDLHLANLIWTGEKMYLIDFETMGTIDYECSMNKQHRINQKIRNDYDHILNHKWIDNTVDDNWKRYQLLIDFSTSMSCEGFYQGEWVTYMDYADRVIEEYYRINAIIL